MLARLVAALGDRRIVVHVDADADLAPFAAIDGIRLVPDRVSVNWGGFSVVDATLRLLRDCLDELGDERDASIVLLSGSDYPVRPTAEFEQYLRTVPWSEHVRAVAVGGDDRFLTNRIRRRWFFDAIRPGRSGWRRKANASVRRTLALVLPRRPRRAYAALRPAVSSQWIVLSRDCLDDLMPQALDPGFQRLFRHTFAPDELFFATLVHSSRWAERTEFGGLEDRGDRLTTEFPNVHYVHPSVAVWLTAVNAADVAASGAFFARKLRSSDLDAFLAALAAERASLPAQPALRGVTVTTTE